MPRWNLAWLLGISGVILLGYAVSHSAPPQEKDQDYELVSLVVRVLNEVDHKYVKPLDYEARRKLVEDMVDAGLERLDPHSSFINARDYKRFTTNSRGKFGGVGIQLTVDRHDRDRLIVLSPMVGTPAYEKGILAGDMIVKINGKPTDTMKVDEAIEMIQGKPGDPVVLTVVHEGATERVDVELVRAEIHVPTVMGDVRKRDDPKKWDYLIDKANKIGYVRLLSFSENTAADLRAVLEGLKKEGARGLVLDLRNNPGGLLHSAVDICQMFLDSGSIVTTKGRSYREEAYQAKHGAALFPSKKDFPIVILINQYSASASEIVAAALQDHGRAAIVGERSFGKGSVQNIIEMEGRQTALKLTTASYWRPSGKNIHRFPDSKDSDEWGVKPDSGLEVKLKLDELREYARDRREKDIVRGKEGATTVSPKNSKEHEKEKKPFVDRVLEKALDYLRGEFKQAEVAEGQGAAA
jgi:carboxyl-terminal processing protease